MILINRENETQLTILLQQKIFTSTKINGYTMSQYQI